jgi:HPt (histidine-containing phosphotransfer) domain-containing protein
LNYNYATHSEKEQLKGVTMKRLHADSPTIDLREFRELCRLEASQSTPFIVKMIKGFLADSVERLQTINALFKTKDFVAAGRCAHNLKSSGCYLGLTRLAKLCTEFESSVNEPKAMLSLLRQIESEFGAAHTELQKYLNAKVRKSLLAAETTAAAKLRAGR